MVDYYRICVSKDGRYLFATEDGNSGSGITCSSDAAKIYALLKEKFPVSDGDKVVCVFHHARCFLIDEFS